MGGSMDWKCNSFPGSLFQKEMHQSQHVNLTKPNYSEALHNCLLLT